MKSLFFWQRQHHQVAATQQPNVLPILHKKKKKKKNKHSNRIVTFADLPDEMFICIFKFVPARELAKRVALVCRRFALLWVQSVTKFEVQGKLRKLKEDEFVRVVRRFVRLESLDVCNTGGSEDFQITDKGLLQLAHKYIYSNADYLARVQNDPMSGEYDFRFDYEHHLDSLDSITESDLDSTMDDDSTSELLSELTPNTHTTSFLQQVAEMATSYNQDGLPTPPPDILVEEITATTDNSTLQGSPVTAKKRTRRVTKQQLTPYHQMMISYGYYYYPPPSKNSPLMMQINYMSNDHTCGPSYGLHTLKSLSLLGCHFITENGVKYLTYIAQNIRHLCLKGCTKLNDAAVAYICQFEHLESLDLTGCTHITNTSMKHLINIKSKHLTSIDLTFCHQVTDDGLKYLAQIPTLQEINLQCCSKLTSKGVSYLLGACKNLKSLNLTGCSLVTLCTVDVTVGDGAVPNLCKINMMGCKLTCDDCLRRLLGWSKNLTEVVLAYSEAITDKGFKDFCASQKHISILNLKRCILLTDKSLEAICCYLKGTMTQLNLTGCRLFTNKGIASLTALKHLKQLLLRKCLQLQEEGIQHLVNNEALEYLDLSEMTLVTETCIYQLCKKLLHLKKLSLQKTQKVSNKFVLLLKEERPNLHILL